MTQKSKSLKLSAEVHERALSMVFEHSQSTLQNAIIDPGRLAEIMDAVRRVRDLDQYLTHEPGPQDMDTTLAVMSELCATIALLQKA